PAARVEAGPAIETGPTASSGGEASSSEEARPREESKRDDGASPSAGAAGDGNWGGGLFWSDAKNPGFGAESAERAGGDGRGSQERTLSDGSFQQCGGGIEGGQPSPGVLVHGDRREKNLGRYFERGL